MRPDTTCLNSVDDLRILESGGKLTTVSTTPGGEPERTRLRENMIRNMGFANRYCERSEATERLSTHYCLLRSPRRAGQQFLMKPAW